MTWNTQRNGDTKWIGEINHTIDAITTASTKTEVTFLSVGKALEASNQILSSLTTRFNAVQETLRSRELSQASQALSDVAAQVVGLGNTELGKSGTLVRLSTSGAVIVRHIGQMDKSVDGIAALVVNAKITAAAIHSSEMDFSTFADEIARTLHMTRAILTRFRDELQSVQNHIATALDGQVAFKARQDVAIGSIPQGLTATVGRITQHHQHVASASTQGQQLSRHITQQVSGAIMALQIGDITRQRLEQIGVALARLKAGDQPEQANLSEVERHALAVAIHRLQTEQLDDTAADFDRHVRQIATSLGNLADEAQTLGNLGSETSGAADFGRSNFLAELENEVAQALDLFAGFATAHDNAGQVIGLVSRSAVNLAAYLNKVQSLEADIRIMGLNTTFKCARLGIEGRALGCIAHELRTCANGFTKEVQALMGEVNTITKTTDALEDDQDHGIASLVAGVTQAMTGALETLRQTGHTLSDALGALSADSAGVMGLLTKTSTQLEGSSAISHAMRAASEQMAAQTFTEDVTLTDLPPRVMQILDRMAQGYTMASQRTIHNRLFGRVSRVEAAPMELEDMLF